MFDFFQNNLAITAAIFALGGVILSALVSLIISRSSLFIMAVTAERSKWIDKLRENIAELLGTCSAIHLTKEQNTPEVIAKKEKADRLIALITMQLNPDNEIDANMIALLRELPVSAEKNGNYRKLEAKFIHHAQFLLKKEWEKVKTEAMGTIFSIFRCRLRKEKELVTRYKKFRNKMK